MNFDTSSVNQRTKKTRPSHLSISVVLGALLLAGCAQTTTRQTPELSKERRSVEPIVSLGGTFKALPAVSNTQSRVVLYRDAQSALTGGRQHFGDVKNMADALRQSEAFQTCGGQHNTSVQAFVQFAQTCV